MEYVARASFVLHSAHLSAPTDAQTTTSSSRLTAVYEKRVFGLSS